MTKWTFKPTDISPSSCHFYASSSGEWKVDENPDKLIAHMKRGKQDFSLWYIPLPIDAEYEINFYSPQVPDAVRLGTFRVSGVRRGRRAMEYTIS